MDLFRRADGMEDKGPTIIGASVSLMTLGLALVVTRVAYRFKSSGMGADDVLIALAVVSAAGETRV
jgi:hypothetical protein